MSDPDVVVIGGGPAGAGAARLLAQWGHSVRLLTRAADPARGAAESLPPSTRKLLTTLGVLDRVERADFYRTTGNTVWWGERRGEVEPFDASPPEDRASSTGYQVLRPVFDRLLLAAAADAGADVHGNASVQRAHIDAVDPATGETAAVVDCQRDGRPETMRCRFVLDASGRAGVIARQGFRLHQPGFRTQAFIGVWHSALGWDVPDPSHTLVETYEDGWAWSVPLSPTLRQVGVAVDGATTRIVRGTTLDETYRAELSKARHLAALMSSSALDRVWACDASLFHAREYGGRCFLLVGDAGSCIDPLSSFGIKKALASAWVGAIVTHTCLRHPDRQPFAIEFFTNWERDIYASNLRRSVDFAREAHARHPHPFWAERAAVDVDSAGEGVDDERLLRAPDVRAAFDALKQSATVAVARADATGLTRQPVIRDNEIVVEDAFALVETPRGIRFLAGVDLVRLSEVACVHDQVPEIFDAYCRSCGVVRLPNFLAALSLLVARGILRRS